MKIKKKIVTVSRNVPVTKTVSKKETIEVFEVTRSEMVAAFLKWNLGVRDQLQNIDVERALRTDAENSVLDADVLIQLLKGQ